MQHSRIRYDTIRLLFLFRAKSEKLENRSTHPRLLHETGVSQWLSTCASHYDFFLNTIDSSLWHVLYLPIAWDVRAFRNFWKQCYVRVVRHFVFVHLTAHANSLFKALSYTMDHYSGVLFVCLFNLHLCDRVLILLFTITVVDCLFSKVLVFIVWILVNLNICCFCQRRFSSSIRIFCWRCFFDVNIVFIRLGFGGFMNVLHVQSERREQIGKISFCKLKWIWLFAVLQMRIWYSTTFERSNKVFEM